MRDSTTFYSGRNWKDPCNTACNVMDLSLRQLVTQCGNFDAKETNLTLLVFTADAVQGHINKARLNQKAMQDTLTEL